MQFAPNQGTSQIDQSGAAGAQRGSSPQRDLVQWGNKTALKVLCECTAPR